MLSKQKIKYIRSLNSKKERIAKNVFVAEGPKIIADLTKYWTPELICYTDDWEYNEYIVSKSKVSINITEEELRKISFLQHPQHILGLFKQKKSFFESTFNQLHLVLDGIQDPGNFGTIIRLADWFGIEYIICSLDTVDVYNPKVVQATMGSLARVKIIYTDLSDFLNLVPKETPIYGTFLEGSSIYESSLSHDGLLVMGNEGSGISPIVKKYINKRISIPNFSNHQEHADSLNVALATAICCSEFKRRLVC